MGKILDLIREGDMRTIGGAADAAALVRAKPALMAELMDLLSYPGAAVRMRASDALEKASANNIDILVPYKALLLDLAEATAQKELRWHFAQVLVRLDLNEEEIDDVAGQFRRWYRIDESSIVRTFVLQGMAVLARRQPALVDEVLALAEQALASNTPSLKVRARKVRAAMERLKSKLTE
jgi:hypothetical protein